MVGHYQHRRDHQGHFQMVPECLASLDASFRALESLESLAMLPSEAQGRRELYNKHMGRRSCRVDERRYSFVVIQTFALPAL